MKTTKTIMAAGLACALAAGSMSVQAAELFNDAVTLVSNSTGVDTNADGLFVIVSQAALKAIINGEKTRRGRTAIARSEVLPWDELTTCDDHPSGELGATLFYLSSTAVIVTSNGDQLFYELDPGNPSYVCARSDSDTQTIVVNRFITGGTGVYANACGYSQYVGTSLSLGDGISSGEGESSGWIYDTVTVDPGTVYGCP